MFGKQMQRVCSQTRLSFAESFSNEDGDGGDEALQKMCLYFTSECRNCVNLFSTPVGLETSTG